MTSYCHSQSYIAITAASVDIPASGERRHPPGQHLIGLGLFIAERDAKHRWRFARRAHAIPAGAPESTLLDWASKRLPEAATPIGWSVDHELVPLLLNATECAPPIIACDFARRLHALLVSGVVDLSLRNGGAGALPLADIAADMAIHAPSWNADAVMAAWGMGDVDQIRRGLADEAMAIWRVFIRTAGLSGMDVEAATDAWVLRRQRMNAVERVSRVR